MRSLFLALFALCQFSVFLQAQTATAPAAGTGTVGDPYQIATLENLYWITQNSSTWNKYFIQTANIDASSTSGWSGGAGMPTIGTGYPGYQYFTGSYNGQDFTISQLYINRSTQNTGLFGFVGTGGMVKNLGLVDVNIIGGADYVGGIAGASVGDIRNCFVTGSVSVSSPIYSRRYIGGLVGTNYGNIDSCYSGALVMGGEYVGGLVGEVWNSGKHVANSYATGQVNSGSSYFRRIGGLVGSLANSGNIINCYATGMLYGVETGGLVGYTDGSAVTISNSFWDTQTTGTATSVAGGTGKTTAEMKTSSTFTSAGWNFTAPWGINASWNNGYPYLRSLVTAPSISSVSPSMNARNISTSSNIVIVFNQSMNGSSMVMNSSIRIDGSQSGRHSASISYNSGTYTATIDPSVDFTAGELVTVTVSTQVTNAGSIPLATPTVWNFYAAGSAADTLTIKTDYTTGTFPIDVIAADLDGDGDLDIAAPNTNSNTVSILLNTGNGSFGAKTDVATGATPRTIAAGDLDRNGSMDIVTTNSTSATDHVSIADLNGDGYPDIAATAYNESIVSVYINNGNGTFPSRVTYTSGANTVALGSADVDGDKDLDLIIGNYEANTVSVLRNNGAGVFGTAETYAVGSNSIYLAMADLDADGDADIAVVNRSSNSVTILKNNGGGTFGSSASYATGLYPFAVSAGDVDGDGDIDLAVSSQNSSTFSILKNNGTGNFSAKTDYAASAGTLGICLADLNQDGDMDIITTNATVNSISVIFNSRFPSVVSSSPTNNGVLASASSNITVTFNTAMNSATFTPGTTVRVSGSQTGLHSGTISFSNGGMTMNFDPAVNFLAGEKVVVVLSSGITSADNIALSARKLFTFTVQTAAADSFAAGITYGTGNGPNEVVAADLDGDGDADLAVVNYTSSTLWVLTNNGNGTFAAGVVYYPGTAPATAAAADVDSDGDIDLLVTNTNSNTLSVFKNNGNGTFASKVDYTTGGYPHGVAVADIDGDGDVDAVVTNYTSNTLSVLKNNGNGTFAAKVDYAAGGAPHAVAAADLDGDSDVDLAVASLTAHAASVLKNNGDGTFAARTEYTVGTQPSSIAAADLDGDGDIDLGLSNYGSSSVSILKNNGNSTFAAKTDYAMGTSAFHIIFADVDGDGDQDMAASNYGAQSMSIRKNNATGIFAEAVNFATGTSPIALTAADLDGDGDIDLAVSNEGSNTISVFKGATYAALPVELTSFTALPRGRGIELRWSTATEVNNHGFELERSAGDGLHLQDRVHLDWVNIGFVEGNGTTNTPNEYSFTDKNLKAGKYSYRLKQVDRDGTFSYSQEVEAEVGSVPLVFALDQNYPNPFNPNTTIGFTLKESGMTTLKIYDIVGREVATLVNEHLEAGVYHQRMFNASQFASGVYFATLTAEGKSQIRKLSLMK
jgi:hypothetical protein